MQSESPHFPSRERLVAKFEALLDESDLIANNDDERGQTFDLLEAFFLDKGRKLLQETFQEKLQERIQRTETTEEARQCPDCKKKRSTRIRKRKL